MTVQTPIENRMEAFRQRWDGKVGKMLIGGEWREAASGETFATEDPSTGDKLADKHLLEEIRQTYPLSVTMAEQIGDLREWAKTRAVLA